MSTPELDDTVASLESEATSKRIPLGWHLLHVGLLVWGLAYFVVFSPWISGWTQEEQLAGGTALEVNITSTIAYTAIPAAALLLMAWAMSRRRRKAAR